MAKLVIPEYPDYERERNTATIRVRKGTMSELAAMAFKARMNKTELASKLLDWAMENVEMRPVALYEVVMPGEAEKEAE